MKNHDGYYDPTAGKTIQRIKKRKKKRVHPFKGHLTYLLREVPNFPMVLKWN